MSSLKALIVDDEPLGRDRIRHLLSERTDLEVEMEVHGGQEAIEALDSGRFDLVFLDIQMPRVDGLSVVRAVGPSAMPPVIFCTAHLGRPDCLRSDSCPSGCGLRTGGQSGHGKRSRKRA